MSTPNGAPSQAPVFTSPWLDTDGAASYLAMSPKTLAVWRSQGKGPTYKLVGERLVRYHRDDLDAFALGEVAR